MTGAVKAWHSGRSELSVPASDARKVERAFSSGADLVFLDLEDSVASSAKAAARAAALDAIRDGDWAGRPRLARVNAIASPWCHRDVIALCEGEVDGLVVPKVSSVGDVAYLDRLLHQLELESGRAAPIWLELQIEEPAGVIAAAEIVRASRRVRRVTFGPGDFAASAGMPLGAIGVADEWDAAYVADRWHLARQTVVLAARAAGAAPVDGPYAAFADDDGFRAHCRRARALGFDGVWCIHPRQIQIANEVFSPSAAEIAAAEAVLASLDASAISGAGAGTSGGVMVDEASRRMAEQTLARSARPDRSLGKGS